MTEETKNKFVFEMDQDEYSDTFAALLFTANELAPDPEAADAVLNMRKLAHRLNQEYVKQGGQVDHVATKEEMRICFGDNLADD